MFTYHLIDDYLTPSHTFTHIVGDNLFGGEKNILYLCDYEKNGMGVS